MKPSYLIAYAALISAGFTTSVQADAILHAFNWKYSDVTANAEHIAAAGLQKRAGFTSDEIEWQRMVGSLSTSRSSSD